MNRFLSALFPWLKKMKNEKMRWKRAKSTPKSLKALKKSSKAKPSKRKAVIKKKTLKGKPAVSELPGEPVGTVTHYFSKARAAAVMVKGEGIAVGDELLFKGHTTRFKQKINSLQIDREPITKASDGQEAGIQVRSKVREGDLVFKL